MSEGLYKAKRKDNNEWVYGDLIHRQIWSSKISVIRCFDSGFDNYEEYEVMPETICEYVGRTDIKGNKVFENDIVNCMVIRNGGTMSNWERQTNINHGKCRTLPMKITRFKPKKFNYPTIFEYFDFELTEEAKKLIEEYEKPIGQEKKKQHINYINIKSEDMLEVIGNILDNYK